MKKLLQDRAVTIVATTTLLAAGFLLGSFWLEWRGTPLEETDRDGARALPSSVPGDRGTRIRVEVLNGMGESGVARRVASRLRDMGFDVVYFGNADHFDHDSTRVILRSDDQSGVQRLADSMGVPRVQARPDPQLYLDGTVILGADWRERMRRRDEGGGGEEEAGGSILERMRERLDGR